MTRILNSSQLSFYKFISTILRQTFFNLAYDVFTVYLGSLIIHPRGHHLYQFLFEKLLINFYIFRFYTVTGRP